MFESFLEDWIQEIVIEPEVKEMSHEVIVDVCNTYNDKRRMRDIRQVRRNLHFVYKGTSLISWSILLFEIRRSLRA